MKTIFAILLIVACASAVTLHDMVLFEEGFLYGLEIKVGNATECINDFNRMAGDITTGYNDITYGIKHLNIPRISRGFTELADAINTFSQEMVSCGVQELEDDIAAIVAELKSPNGIIKLIVDEAIVFFFHSKELTKDIKTMIFDWKEANYFPAGKNLGQFVGILIEKK